MKKSSGSPTRIRARDTEIPARPVIPVQAGKEPRRWTGYLAAGAAVIILILLVLPCQFRRCCGDRDHEEYASRFIMSGIPYSAIEKRPVDSVKGPDHTDKKRLHTPKRVAPHRDKVPVERADKNDGIAAKERGAVKPAERSRQPGKIETDERGALNPDNGPDRRGERGADGKGAVKPHDKPENYDFGTKIELVIPGPRTR